MSEQPVAFMSYVRLDDEHEGGWLTEFCTRLSGEVRMQTGETFRIFQDRKDIAWGQNWKQRIVESLESVNFLIPIITPGFFKSEACREEFALFAQREKRLGRNDLILPLYYITCPVLSDDASREADAAAKLIASRQHVDWRELRFESFSSPQVRKTIASIAGQIVEATARAAASSSSVQPAIRNPEVSDESRSTGTSPLPVGRKRKSSNKPREPSTRIVDALHRGNHVSIGAALRASQAGDRILVRPGLYRESLVISKAIEIIGDGATNEVVIESTNKEAVLFRASMGRIANLTLRQIGAQRVYCVKIMRGRLDIEGCQISNRSIASVAILDGADPRLRRSVIHGGKSVGVVIYDNGLGTLEDNEIHGNQLSGVEIKTGGNPTLRRNRIYSGNQAGVLVHESGLGTLEDNEIYDNAFAGIEIRTNANPIVRRNRIHDGKESGVLVGKDGLGTIEENEIFGNSSAGIVVKEAADPIVRRNRIFDGKGAGIYVRAAARGSFENNEIFKNANSGFRVSTEATPTVRYNRIYEGKSVGVLIESNGQGLFEHNEIIDNEKVGFEIRSGGKPTLRHNRVSGHKFEAIWIHEGGKGFFERNDLTGNQKGAWDIAPECQADVERTRNTE